MSSGNKLKGERGETLAQDFILRKGWRILEMNWKGGQCEIDIIAKEGKTLVFIEVKTRSSSAYGWPEEAVNAAKQRNIAKAAEIYIEEKNLECDLRFDVVSIIIKNGKPEIYHIMDAFVPEGE